MVPGTPGSLADPGDQREQRGLRPAGEPGRCPRGGTEPSGYVQPGAVLTRCTGPGRVPVQAADPLPVDAAVGDQRPVPGHTQLAAMGVAGQQQVIAIGGEPVQVPRLG